MSQNENRAQITEQQITAEIDAFKGKHQGRLAMRFFNNFDANLPGGWYLRLEPESLSKQSTDPAASERLKGQTYREFFAECEKTMLELNISQEQIITARKGWQQSGSYNQRSEDEFVALLKPIYVALRLKGYNHYPDLVS